MLTDRACHASLVAAASKIVADLTIADNITDGRCCRAGYVCRSGSCTRSVDPVSRYLDIHHSSAHANDSPRAENQ